MSKMLFMQYESLFGLGLAVVVSFGFNSDLILKKWKEILAGSNSERLINCRCNMMS